MFPSSQSYGCSSGHVWMWELDYKESWVLKNGCFWTVVFEKTLESPLDCKEIQPVHHKGNQSWIVIGRIDVEAETAKLWPPDAKNWLIWKNRDAGKDWRWEEKGMTENEMVWWHHQLSGHSLSKLWKLVMDREAWHAEVQVVTKSQTWLSNWTDWLIISPKFQIQDLWLASLSFSSVPSLTVTLLCIYMALFYNQFFHI